MSLTSTEFLTIVDATQPNSVNIWYNDTDPLYVYGLTIPAVDNNGNDDQLIKDVEKEIRRKLNSPVKNPKGKRWLKTPTDPSDPCGFIM